MRAIRIAAVCAAAAVVLIIVVVVAAGHSVHKHLSGSPAGQSVSSGSISSGSSGSSASGTSGSSSSSASGRSGTGSSASQIPNWQQVSHQPGVKNAQQQLVSDAETCATHVTPAQDPTAYSKLHLVGTLKAYGTNLLHCFMPTGLPQHDATAVRACLTTQAGPNMLKAVQTEVTGSGSLNGREHDLRATAIKQGAHCLTVVKLPTAQTGAHS